MTRLLRFWFTFDERVSREAYLRHGLALMAVKYAVDAALIYAVTVKFWSPLDYLHSIPFLLSSTWSTQHLYLAPIMGLWMLPFLWIGMTMTIRRLLDVGWSAWWSLLFFVPFASYILMITLALVPCRAAEPHTARPPDPHGDRLPSALLSIGLGAGLGLLLLWLAAEKMNSYGMALFMGTPFCIGLVTAFTLCRRYPASRREMLEVVAMTILIVGGAGFAIGSEGALCLLMVAPLGVIVAFMGGVVGRFLAMRGEPASHGALLIAILLPGGVAVESGSSPASLREVRSAVVIAAAPSTLWAQVIAFSPIDEPPSILFRLGLAYPIRAEIKGSGVGAIRYCVFSTGAFIEPITAWEPGRRLTFDVIESPPPLRELSFRKVAPPHLEGYLLPRRGEFRLVQMPDGRTRLEGSTWYEQRLRPEGYWVLFSDYLIGRIHRRVLEHIKTEAEQDR